MLSFSLTVKQTKKDYTCMLHWELSYNLHPLAEKACVTDSVKRNIRHNLFVKITTKDLFISRAIISITRSIMFSKEKCVMFAHTKLTDLMLDVLGGCQVIVIGC